MFVGRHRAGPPLPWRWSPGRPCLPHPLHEAELGLDGKVGQELGLDLRQGHLLNLVQLVLEEVKRTSLEMKRKSFEMNRNSFEMKRKYFEIKKKCFETKRKSFKINRKSFEMKGKSFETKRNSFQQKVVQLLLKNCIFLGLKKLVWNINFRYMWAK